MAAALAAAWHVPPAVAELALAAAPAAQAPALDRVLVAACRHAPPLVLMTALEAALAPVSPPALDRVRDHALAAAGSFARAIVSFGVVTAVLEAAATAVMLTARRAAGIHAMRVAQLHATGDAPTAAEWIALAAAILAATSNSHISANPRALRLTDTSQQTTALWEADVLLNVLWLAKV